MQCADAVLYCHLWHVRLYHMVPHYLKHGTIFGEKLLNTKCVFYFSLQLLSETLPIIERIQRDIIANVHVFMYGTRFFGQNLMKLEFSRYIFEKYSNFMKIRPVGTELFHAGPANGGQT